MPSLTKVERNLNRTARCCCGNAAIEVNGEPEVLGLCHCDNCKTRTGSAFGISAYFNNAQIRAKKGEFSCYAFNGSQTKAVQKRYFCATCGTTLFWTVSTSPDLTGIAGGCFVEHPLSEPSYSSSCNSKFSWVKLPWRWQKYA